VRPRSNGARREYGMKAGRGMEVEPLAHVQFVLCFVLCDGMVGCNQCAILSESSARGVIRVNGMSQ
jgi:hypothetical protein